MLIGRKSKQKVNMFLKLMLFKKMQSKESQQGVELCFAQQVKRFKKHSCESKKVPFKVINGDVNLGIQGKNLRILISKATGGIVSYIFEGQEILKTTPRTIFARALTDNDRGKPIRV